MHGMHALRYMANRHRQGPLSPYCAHAVASAEIQHAKFREVRAGIRAGQVSGQTTGL